MDITELKPAGLFHYFNEICQIPRPSKHEEKILAYLVDFAKKHNLEYKQDKIGNVVILKPATPGYENRQTTILQSHVDMVCEKNNDVEHDFFKDPIVTLVEGDWLKAKGTTLGADNGIGVATQLAILADNSLEHGPIEALFTVDEETGLTGAFELADNMLSGSILINLDSEDEGELFIGCSGGIDSVAEFTYKTVEVPQAYFFFKVDIKGLKGGHSGGDIHLGLGNANKILNRFLHLLNKKSLPNMLAMPTGPWLVADAWLMADGGLSNFASQAELSASKILANLRERPCSKRCANNNGTAVNKPNTVVTKACEMPEAIIAGSPVPNKVIA